MTDLDIIINIIRIIISNNFLCLKFFGNRYKHRILKRWDRKWYSRFRTDKVNRSNVKTFAIVKKLRWSKMIILFFIHKTLANYLYFHLGNYSTSKYFQKYQSSDDICFREFQTYYLSWAKTTTSSATYLSLWITSPPSPLRPYT